jgi:hypothetical protein
MGRPVFLIAPGTLLAQIAVVVSAEIIPKRRNFLSAILEERSNHSCDAEDDEDGAYDKQVSREPGHCVLLCVEHANRSENQRTERLCADIQCEAGEETKTGQYCSLFGGGFDSLHSAGPLHTSFPLELVGISEPLCGLLAVVS